MYRGTWKGQQVAIKLARVTNTDSKAAIESVRQVCDEIDIVAGPKFTKTKTSCLSRLQSGWVQPLRSDHNNSAH